MGYKKKKKLPDTSIGYSKAAAAVLERPGGAKQYICHSSKFIDFLKKIYQRTHKATGHMLCKPVLYSGGSAQAEASTEIFKELLLFLSILLRARPFL